jgi:hypothetical protein
MEDFRTAIQEEGKTLRELHERVQRTFAKRTTSGKGQEDWNKACKAIHSYHSPLEEYFRSACEEPTYIDKRLIDFAISFLEADPYYFRSGYLKAIFLKHLKRSALAASHTKRLLNVLVDAAQRRGTREFKYYCRLATRLYDPELVRQLQLIAEGPDEIAASRAKLMLKYIADSQR